MGTRQRSVCELGAGSGDEVERVVLRVQPGIGLVAILRLQRPRKVAYQRKLVGIDGQCITVGVLLSGQQIAITQICKHRVAFVRLAAANQPEVQPARHNPIFPAAFNFGLQSDAIEFGDLEALVKSLIDRKVLGMPSLPGEVQCIAVTKFAGGL